MPGSTPPISQLDWLISMTAMIVLFWSRATRDLLKSFGWGIGALHRFDAATKVPFPRRPPHSISRSPSRGNLLILSYEKGPKVHGLRRTVPLAAGISGLNPLPPNFTSLEALHNQSTAEVP